MTWQYVILFNISCLVLLKYKKDFIFNKNIILVSSNLFHPSQFTRKHFNICGGKSSDLHLYQLMKSYQAIGEVKQATNTWFTSQAASFSDEAIQHLVSHKSFNNGRNSSLHHITINNNKMILIFFLNSPSKLTFQISVIIKTLIINCCIFRGKWNL